MSEIVWVCQRCNKPQAGNRLACWKCGYTVYRPTFPDDTQSVDSPLGLTEQQHADSVLNEMIETLPPPLKNMSGMYNGMTVQPVDNPVDSDRASYATPEA